MKKLSIQISSLWLISILIAAAIFRVESIDQPFVDFVTWREADNATIADNFYKGHLNVFLPKISWNGSGENYVGYEFQTLTYLAGGLYHLWGRHDWVGRIIPVAFGVWGIFALYRLVRCVWDEKRALVSAAMMAFLPGSIFIDRSFICDPIMVSLVITSFWMLVVYLQTNKFRFLAMAVLIGIWGFLTKVSGLIVGIPMIYAMVTILRQEGRFNPKTLRILLTATGIVLVPVITYYLWARHIYLHYPPHHIAGAGNWFWDSGLAKLLTEGYHLSKTYWSFETWLWMKPMMLLVGLGLCLRLPQAKMSTDIDRFSDESSSKAPWLFHWWILAMTIYYVVGAQELAHNPWNFHLVSPAGAALAGHAIVTVAEWLNRFVRFPALWIVLTALVLILVSGLRSKYLASGFNPYEASMQEGYELGLALNKITQPSDLLIAVAEEIGNPISIYYSQRTGWIFPPVESKAEWWDDIKNEDAAIDSLKILHQKGVKWFGISNRQKTKIWQQNPKLARQIERNYKLHQETPKWAIYRSIGSTQNSTSQ
jgi:4-amino-4-deoxy-L-arabinose transferase-like glycosyltransferase